MTEQLQQSRDRGNRTRIEAGFVHWCTSTWEALNSIANWESTKNTRIRDVFVYFTYTFVAKCISIYSNTFRNFLFSKSQTILERFINEREQGWRKKKNIFRQNRKDTSTAWYSIRYYVDPLNRDRSRLLCQLIKHEILGWIGTCINNT